MRKAILLALAYFLMQFCGALIAGPCTMLYLYLTEGSFERAGTATLAPAMLLSFVFMLLFLRSQRYLDGDKLLYRPQTAPYLCWSLLAGISLIYLTDFLIEQIGTLPDWNKDMFADMMSSWLGALCISVLGPVLEELLFRGAVTKELLRRYSPAKAIVISGLIFGLVHINPVQVVSASLSGFFFAWLYYRTRSVVPGILIHIVNNSLSTWLTLTYPEMESTAELIPAPMSWILLALSVLLLCLSLKMLLRYPLPSCPDTITSCKTSETPIES